MRIFPAASATVPSPCVNVCKMDAASGLCRGCRRTLDEIAAWSTLDDTARRAVWARIAQRPAFPPESPEPPEPPAADTAP